MKLKIKYFGITCGALWGLIIFTSTWWLIARGLFVNETTFLGYFYPYYTISPLGSIIGLAYGIADGFFLGVVFAWFYNMLVKRSKINQGHKGDNHEYQ
jgi:hypothetical protein